MTRDPLGDPYVVGRHWQRWAVYRIAESVDAPAVSVHDDEIDATAACARLNAEHHARWAARRARRAG